MGKRHKKVCLFLTLSLRLKTEVTKDLLTSMQRVWEAAYLSRGVARLINLVCDANVVSEEWLVPVHHSWAVVCDDPHVTRAVVHTGRSLVPLQHHAVPCVAWGTHVLATGGRPNAFHIAVHLVVARPSQQQTVEHHRWVHAWPDLWWGVMKIKGEQCWHSSLIDENCILIPKTCTILLSTHMLKTATLPYIDSGLHG